MNTEQLFDTKHRYRTALVLGLCLLVLVVAVVVAWLVQRGFGRVEVTNVTYDNSSAC